jgi:hypothetical protein
VEIDAKIIVGYQTFLQKKRTKFCNQRSTIIDRMVLMVMAVVVIEVSKLALNFAIVLIK